MRIEPRLLKFSVLLAFPPEWQPDEQVLTWYLFVEARSSEEAVQLAQRKIADAYGVSEERSAEAEPLLVTLGHHPDVR